MSPRHSTGQIDVAELKRRVKLNARHPVFYFTMLVYAACMILMLTVSAIPDVGAWLILATWIMTTVFVLTDKPHGE